MEVPLNHLFFNPCFLINHQFLGITIYGNHHFSWAFHVAGEHINVTSPAGDQASALQSLG
jgi:hypothetical protein